MSKVLTMADLKAELRQYTGTESYYLHNINKRFLFTDGVRKLRDIAGCNWLIDLIASDYTVGGQIEKSVKDGSPHFWHLTVDDSGKAKARCCHDISGPDGPLDHEVILTQEIEWTDFPPGTFHLYVGCADMGSDNNPTGWVCYLPSEH